MALRPSISSVLNARISSSENAFPRQEVRNFRRPDLLLVLTEKVRDSCRGFISPSNSTCSVGSSKVNCI